MEPGRGAGKGVDSFHKLVGRFKRSDNALQKRMCSVSSTLPVLIWIIWVWQKHARPAFLRVRIAISNVNASLAENF